MLFRSSTPGASTRRVETKSLSKGRGSKRARKGELLDITHELAEHLRRGEEVFKVEKRRRALRQSLESVEKALDSIENAGGADLEPIHEQCNALRTKLGQLRAHIKGVPDDPEPARPVTRWPMYVFLSGAVVCLFFSTLCHTYCCIGARDAERMWRLDYLGIAVLIVSSFYPMVHYSYYCLPGWRDMYITGITSLGCLAAIPTLLTAFQKKEYGPLRASLFVALGLFGIFPIFQQILFVWRIVPTPMMEAFVLEMLMGGGYIFGAFLYAQGIPERWYPGLFDFIGLGIVLVGRWRWRRIVLFFRIIMRGRLTFLFTSNDFSLVNNKIGRASCRERV